MLSLELTDNAGQRMRRHASSVKHYLLFANFISRRCNFDERRRSGSAIAPACLLTVEGNSTPATGAEERPKSDYAGTRVGPNLPRIIKPENIAAIPPKWYQASCSPNQTIENAAENSGLR